MAIQTDPDKRRIQTVVRFSTISEVWLIYSTTTVHSVRFTLSITSYHYINIFSGNMCLLQSKKFWHQKILYWLFPLNKHEVYSISTHERVKDLKSLWKGT